MIRCVSSFFIMIFFASMCRSDVVLYFSSSDTTFNNITSKTIVENSSASSVENRVYIWAQDTNFGTKGGLGSYSLTTGPAGAISNSVSASNLGKNILFDVGTPSYNGTTNTGSFDIAKSSGGVSADVNNRIYLGYFGLAGLGSGTANLNMVADNGSDPFFLWLYGDGDAATVNPTSYSLSVTVTAVPEPGTLCLLGTALAGFAGYAGLRKRRNNRK